MSSWFTGWFGADPEYNSDSDEEDKKEVKQNANGTKDVVVEEKPEEKLHIPRGHIMTINKNFEQLTEHLISHDQQKVIVITQFEPPPDTVDAVAEKIEKKIIKQRARAMANDDDNDFGYFPPDMRGTYSNSSNHHAHSPSDNTSASNGSRRIEAVDIDFNTTIELYSAYGVLLHTVHSRPDLVEKGQKKKNTKNNKKNAASSSLNDNKITCCRLVEATAEGPNEDQKKKKISPLRFRTDAFSLCLRPPFEKNEDDDEDEELKKVKKNPIIDKVEALVQKAAHLEGIAYMLITVTFPTLDLELKAIESSELVRHTNGQLTTTKVITRKVPRTNRFLTRVLVVDPKAPETHLSPLEICRFTSTVDNYDRTDKDRVQLVGMFHVSPPSWTWQFRSTNHYKPVPPKKLKITVHEVIRQGMTDMLSMLSSVEDDFDDDSKEYNSMVKLQFGTQKNKTKIEQTPEFNETFEFDITTQKPDERLTVRYIKVTKLIHKKELIGLVQLPPLYEMFDPINKGNRSYQFYKNNYSANTEEGKTRPKLTKSTAEFKILAPRNEKEGIHIASEADEKATIKLTITLEW